MKSKMSKYIYPFQLICFLNCSWNLHKKNVYVVSLAVKDVTLFTGILLSTDYTVSQNQLASACIFGQWLHETAFSAVAPWSHIVLATVYLLLQTKCGFLIQIFKPETRVNCHYSLPPLKLAVPLSFMECLKLEFFFSIFWYNQCTRSHLVKKFYSPTLIGSKLLFIFSC